MCCRHHRTTARQVAACASPAPRASGASPRNLLRIILKGAWDDVGPLCRPHLRERGDLLRDQLTTWIKAADEVFAGLYAQHPRKDDPGGWDRKAFALAVQAADLPLGPMMSMWSGQVPSTRAWIDGRAKAGEWGDGFLDNLAEMVSAPIAAKQ